MSDAAGSPKKRSKNVIYDEDAQRKFEQHKAELSGLQDADLENWGRRQMGTWLHERGYPRSGSRADLVAQLKSVRDGVPVPLRRKYRTAGGRGVAGMGSAVGVRRPEHMTVSELKTALRKEGRSVSGDRSALVNRLRADPTEAKPARRMGTSRKRHGSAASGGVPENMTIGELKEALREKGRSATGNRDDLIERLKADASDAKPARKQGTHKRSRVAGSAVEPEEMTVVELKAALRKEGRAVAGSREALIKRLKADPETAKRGRPRKNNKRGRSAQAAAASAAATSSTAAAVASAEADAKSNASSEKTSARLHTLMKKTMEFNKLNVIGKRAVLIIMDESSTGEAAAPAEEKKRGRRADPAPQGQEDKKQKISVVGPSKAAAAGLIKGSFDFIDVTK